MIKIKKNNQTPQVIAPDKTLEARNNLEKKIKNGETLTSEDFKSGIYNGDGVKKQLLHDQNDKCAYCEVSLAGDFGNVEHYRPKTGWQENKGDTLNKPGYYWLAYEWTNLLCSCDKCNSSSRKGNLFPLRDSQKRGIAMHDISQEVPLIINPALEEPGLYLRFNKYYAVPKIINGQESDKGRNTIDIFDLNGRIRTEHSTARTDLLKLRKDKWDEARELYNLCKAYKMNEKEAIDKVKEIYAKPEKVFSGMFINQDLWFK